MSVYITGDCHGKWNKLINPKCYSPNVDIKKGDYIIVCGDFGIWHDDDGDESEKLDRLEQLDYTILFVSGNHENFDRLYSDEFEVVDFCGGKAQKIRNNVYHLMRGNVFELEGKKFFAFGGASSHDISDGIIDPDDYESHEEFYRVCREWYNERRMFRIKGMSWWERELPTDKEMEYGKAILAEHNNEVDFVISHCLPQQAAAVFSRGGYKHDKLTNYFDEIVEENRFTKWYCGHYHTDWTVMGKFVILYDCFERVI